MTRDEFIDGYIARSPFCDAYDVKRTPFGFGKEGKDDGFIALPCQCDYDECHGWAMMPDSFSTVLLHCKTHLPDGMPPPIFDMHCKRCGGDWLLPYSANLLSLVIRHEPMATCPHCFTTNIFALTVKGYKQESDHGSREA